MIFVRLLSNGIIIILGIYVISYHYGQFFYNKINWLIWTVDNKSVIRMELNNFDHTKALVIGRIDRVLISHSSYNKFSCLPP
jgi:hypothetical protein